MYYCARRLHVNVLTPALLVCDQIRTAHVGLDVSSDRGGGLVLLLLWVSLDGAGWQVNTNGSLTQGYILPAGMCGCGCYQDKIAVLGAGGMEIIASAASAQIAQWAYGADAAARPASVYSKM